MKRIEARIYVGIEEHQVADGSGFVGAFEKEAGGQEELHVGDAVRMNVSPCGLVIDAAGEAHRAGSEVPVGAGRPGARLLRPCSSPRIRVSRSMLMRAIERPWRLANQVSSDA